MKYRRPADGWPKSNPIFPSNLVLSSGEWSETHLRSSVFPTSAPQVINILVASVRSRWTMRPSFSRQLGSGNPPPPRDFRAIVIILHMWIYKTKTDNFVFINHFRENQFVSMYFHRKMRSLGVTLKCNLP